MRNSGFRKVAVLLSHAACSSRGSYRVRGVCKGCEQISDANYGAFQFAPQKSHWNGGLNTAMRAISVWAPGCIPIGLICTLMYGRMCLQLMNTEEPRVFKLGHHDWLLLQAACASVNALFTNRGTSKGQTVAVSFVFEGQFSIHEWNGLQKTWTSLICRAVRFTLPILVSKKWWWIASFIRTMVGTNCLPIKIQPSQRPGSGVDLFRVPFREGLCECWLRRWDQFMAYGRCTGYIYIIL